MNERQHYVRRHAIWGGIAAAVLFAAGNAIWALGMPSAGTPIPEILDFYDERANRIVIGGSISLLAIAVFVLFAAAARQLLNEAGADEFLTTTAFGGAVLTAAVGTSAETINMVAAMRSRDGELGEALAQSLFELSQNFGSTASGLGLAIFAVAIGVAGLRSGALSPWRSWLVLAVGVVLFTPLARFNVAAGTALILVSLTIAIGLLRGPKGNASLSG